jgi:hypothetical protein
MRAVGVTQFALRAPAVRNAAYRIFRSGTDAVALLKVTIAPPGLDVENG